MGNSNPLNHLDPGFFEQGLDYVVQLDQGVRIGSTYVLWYIEVFGLLKVSQGYNLFGKWVFYVLAGGER